MLANYYTATYKRRAFQLAARQPAIVRPNAKGTINTHLDGSIALSGRKVEIAEGGYWASCLVILVNKPPGE